MKYLLTNRLHVYLILVISVLMLTGCGDLFKVKNPNAIRAEQIDEDDVDALANSAEGALSQAYSRAIVVAGMASDGIINAVTQQGGDRFIDFGLFEGFHAFTGDTWNQLAAARWTTTEVVKRLKKLLDNPQSDMRLARSYFWDAIARITLADMYRAIPFNNGKPNTPIEVYEGAIERLKKAAQIAKAAPDSPESTKYLAASFGTLARVYRSLYFERGGDMSAFKKAADYAKKALNIDPDFYIEMRYEAPGSQNNVYLALSQFPYDYMDPDYTKLRDPVTGKQDPRIKHSQQVGTSTKGIPLYRQLKYPNGNANVPISRWQEAELIIAEYYVLNNMKLNEAVDRINRVRNAAGLSDFSSNDPQRIYKQIKYERKAEFWLELRRWQDMRYYNIIPDRWKPRAVQKGIDRRFHVSQREKFANPYM